MMRFKQVGAACRHTSRRTYHREYTMPTYEELAAGSAARTARIQMARVSPLAKNLRHHLADLFADVESRGMSVTDVFMSPSAMQILHESGCFDGSINRELWAASVTILNSMRKGEVLLVEGEYQNPVGYPKTPSMRTSLLPWSTPHQPTSKGGPP